MDLKLELVVVPVSDVDRAKAFSEQVGFVVDVDHRAGDDFRIVQLTPPGSACSIGIGVGITDGPARLVSRDAPGRERRRRGGDGAPRTGDRCRGPVPLGPGGRATGLYPGREDYGSFASFADPDGNLWLLQAVGYGIG